MTVRHETPLTPEQVVTAAIQRLRDGDDGAHWEPDVLEAAARLYAEDRAEFQRQRGELKSVGSRAQITEWTRVARGGIDSAGGDTKADQLVALVRARAELFHDPEGGCFATFEQEDHRETWQLGSRGFAQWMSYVAYRDLGFAPGEATVASALATLKGIALHDGREISVYLRCAPVADGYMIDLTDARWRAVKVTATGWRIVDRPTVRFIRSGTAAPLPVPRTDGDVALLWNHVNIPENERILVLAFLLDSWRPDTPYPVLELCGEQGSAKSSTHERLRQLSDPNTVPLRAKPKSREDIFVAAANNHQASFENMSGISASMQDALCTLATGGGFAARKLYSDADESVIAVKRPVIANGIHPIATRPDLIDRTVHIDLPRIEVYRAEAELDAAFASDYAFIFGGLLDLFSRTLEKQPGVNIDHPPRMADFAVLGEAMVAAMGEDAGTFVDAYRLNRSGSLMRSLQASPVAMAVVSLMDHNDEWKGTVKELKQRLDDSHKQEGEGWPKSPEGLSHALTRLAPALREVGIEVARGRHTNRGNTVHISSSKSSQKPVQPSKPSSFHDACPKSEGVQDVRDVPESPKGTRKAYAEVL